MLAADGVANEEIARRCATTLDTVRRWRARFAQTGVDGVGTIAFTGQRSDGSHSVQFNDAASNTGYSSTWPAWAFQLAKAALLGDRRVWVLANGSPFGSNLTTVLILR